MMTTPVSATPPTAPSARPASGFATLGQGDFLKLMTVQMQQQDPFNPVDQKEMLAQMAQFSSLAGITESNATLQSIAAKLDMLIAAPAPAAPATTPPTASTQET